MFRNISGSHLAASAGGNLVDFFSLLLKGFCVYIYLKYTKDWVGNSYSFSRSEIRIL